MAMDYISKDVIGLFESTSKENQYELPVLCTLTNYAMCVSLACKSADIVVNAY